MPIIEGYGQAPARRSPSGGSSRGKGGRGASGRARRTAARPPARRSSTGSAGGYRAGASQPAYRPRTSGTVSRRPQNVKARPILPTPSADAIADLFSQIAGFKREGGQLRGNYMAQTGEMRAARELYLKQLADTYGRQRTSALEDFAARGLADSGIANEALARLEGTYRGQIGEYETEYGGNIAELRRTLQGRRADLAAQRAAVERRYNQMRAQRAASLRAAGYGG